MHTKSGKLYLIPAPIDDEAVHVIPAYVKEVIHSLSDFVVENEKTARQYLKKTGYPRALDQARMHRLDEHSSGSDISHLIDPLLQGRNTGLISEAGCPGVADPGADLVKIAHQKNIEVIPLVGPSSILLALMGSGLNGQSFAFAGYLPKDRPARVNAIRELERLAISKNQSQVFIEAPYRNDHLLEDILATCKPGTQLCIAVNITGKNESIHTREIGEWKKKIPTISKQPVIFILGR